MNADQIYVFFVCLFCGVASGPFYDAFYLLKKLFPARAGVALDIVFCLFFAGLYIFLAVLFSLPEMRLFMFVGCLLGFLVYLKSFHRIVAFFTEWLYNNIIRRRK